jgi:DNA invertase Pin-like site-specific DNA recombinase
MSASPQRKRCAIYTRKSSEEGLEQAFNSLDAQREACEAYVLSQAGEGWECLPTLYDDGGWSGGNMDRPAIKQLLDDIRQGRVDIVVVYKVDRLTRSLMDFARIVEIFDAQNVSFVSVTQAFNTTSSMGRLTLNVLLSFAQFEREVTGERIRDKIAASRARGIWMGGNIPIGYDLGDRRLEVNDADAATVQHMFTRYTELHSLTALAHELRQQGIVSKRRTSRSGCTTGGVTLSVGAISHILNNRVYLGEATHKGKSYPGEHAAIIDPDLFEAVQAILAGHRIRRHTRKTRAASSPLIGKICDSDGQPMCVSFSYGRGSVMYRYYVSECLTVAGRFKAGASNYQGIRLPATRTENAVAEMLAPLAISPVGPDHIFSALERLTVMEHRLLVEIDGAGLFPEGTSTALMLARAQVIDPDAIIAGSLIKLSVQSTLVHKGKSVRSPDAAMMGSDGKSELAELVRTAHRYLAKMNASPQSPTNHAVMSAPATEWIRRRIVVGLLAPDIQKGMLAGTLPAHVTAHWVLAHDWPLNWDEQRRMIGKGG